MDPENWELVGVLTKTQGVEGELLLKVKNDFPENHDFGQPVFIPIERTHEGTPFYFTSCERISKKHYAVRFDLIDNESRASRLIGLEVRLPLSDHHEQEAQPELLEKVQGYRVIDRQQGEIGIIQGGIDRPEQPIAHVGEAAIPLPLTEAFVERIDEEARILYTDLPEGLTEL